MRNNTAGHSAALQPQDMVYLCEILARHGQEAALRSLLEDEDALDQILALEVVFRQVIESPAIVGISPQFYFMVVVRHVFNAAGVGSRPLNDYVAVMLARRVRRASDPTGDGEMPDYAVDVLERVQQARGREEFAWWRSAGDHFLLLTGLFAEHLERRCERQGAPALDYYEEFGARSYRAAAEHPQARRTGLTEVLHDLSEKFAPARKALNVAAEEYLFLAN